MGNLKFDKRTFIHLKVYFDRAKMYIGYIQSFLIVIVFIRSFKSNFFSDIIFKYSMFAIPFLLMIFIILSLLIGYIDYKLGFRQEEFRNLSISNPVLMNLYESIESIKNDISEIKDKMNQENKDIDSLK